MGVGGYEPYSVPLLMIYNDSKYVHFAHPKCDIWTLSAYKGKSKPGTIPYISFTNSCLCLPTTTTQRVSVVGGLKVKQVYDYAS